VHDVSDDDCDFRLQVNEKEFYSVGPVGLVCADDVRDRNTNTTEQSFINC
jgi:hypothetical protein